MSSLRGTTGRVLESSWLSMFRKVPHSGAAGSGDGCVSDRKVEIKGEREKGEKEQGRKGKWEISPFLPLFLSPFLPIAASFEGL